MFVSQAIYGHSGTLMNGDPLVCGGYNNGVYKADCFYYQKDTKEWQKVKKDLIIKFLNFHKNTFSLFL